MVNKVVNPVNKHDCKGKPAVLHLIDTTGPGGAETIFIQLAHQMQNKGWRSIVVIRGEGWVCDELIRLGLSPIILDAKGSFNIKFLWALVRLVKKEQIKLIHSHLLGSNVYAALVGLLSFCPVVATYHGMVDVSPNERFKRIKHWAMRWGIKRYVVVSKSLATNILEQGLLRPKYTSVIYNGVDTNQYSKIASKQIRESLGLSTEALLIGSLGNIRPAKAYDVLIEAAASVIKSTPNVHFVIAGHQKSSLMAALNTQIDSLGISGSIHFLGFQADSAAMLAQMDIFVLSSTSEGFSISTIEAMATGLPLVATKCGGPEEIVTHNKNGWLVEKANPAALAEGLLTIINDQALQQRLAANAVTHVSETFSSEKMLNEYDALYKTLVD